MGIPRGFRTKGTRCLPCVVPGPNSGLTATCIIQARYWPPLQQAQAQRAEGCVEIDSVFPVPSTDSVWHV